MTQTVTAPATGPRPLHIFAPGKWTTMAGETIEFSAADLRASAAAFNPARAKAPIVIGHPATDDPAQGWVAELQATERGLFATPTQVDPAFAQAARAGRWGTVSAKFYRPTDAANPVPGVWYLRHVGVLGAQSPALKGLDDPTFAQGEDDGCVAFAQGVAFGGWEDRTQASLWRSLREFIVGKFGREEADAVIPQYQVQSLEQYAEAEMDDELQSQAVPAAAFAEPTPTPTQEATVSPEEKAALLAQNTDLAAQLAALQAEQARTLATQRHAAHVAFCEDLGAQARLLPAAQPVAIALLDHLGAQSAPVQFGEGEAQAPLIDGFKAFLAARPAQVEFGEVATGARAAAGAGTPVQFAAPQGYSVDPLAMVLHAKAVAHQLAHPGTSYVQAVQAVA